MSEPLAPGLFRERLRTLYARTLAGSVPPSGDVIYGLPIPGFEAHRLGRDCDGSVCLILAARSMGQPTQPDIRLENLSVRRRMECEINQPTGMHESVVGTVITCSANSAEVRWLFLEMLDQALEAMGPTPSEREVDYWVDHARRLFAELESPPRELRRLWGELFVMCESSDPESLVRRWHEDPQDRFEFVHRNYALVVKTCGGLDRVHRFTLAQLRPGTDMEVVIASVPVQSNPEGASVIDLARELDKRLLDRHVRTRLREIVFQMGGAALASANARFDLTSAREGYCLMRAQAIPAITEPLPRSVLAVQLEIDCEDVAKEDLAATIVGRLRS